MAEDPFAAYQPVREDPFAAYKPAAAKPPAEPAVGSREKPFDDTEHAAGFGTIARASLPPDEKVQIQRYAEAFKQPVTDFETTKDGHVIRKIPGTDTYARVQASVRGGKGPLDMAERAMDWVAGGAGQAIPAIASIPGAVIGAAVGNLPGAVIGGAAAASAGEVARQKLDAWLDGEDAPMDYGNVAWQGVAGAGGPLVERVIGSAVKAAAPAVVKGLAKIGADEGAQAVGTAEGAAVAREVAGGAVPAGVGAASTFGLSPRIVAALREHLTGKQDDVAQLIKEMESFGVQGSLGQVTGSDAVQIGERQLLRQPETVQAVNDLRRSQNSEQLPAAVRQVMDDIAPDEAASTQIANFREAGNSILKKALKERSTAAESAYGEANKGGSVAALEDQFRDAVVQITSQKGQIARQIADIEKNQSGALAARGAAGKDVRDTYMALREELEAIEKNRVAAMERLTQAKADKSANAPGAVWSPRLQEFLDDPAIKPGIAKGLEIQRLEALARGEKFNPVEYGVIGKAEDGSPIIGAVPNSRLLHAVKKGIDGIIEENTDPTGQVNALGRAARMVKDSYLDEFDKLNPAYAAARKQFSEDSHMVDMIKEGGVGLLNRMTGLDRQAVVNGVLNGKNMLDADVAEMRRLYIYAGKEKEWRGAVRSFIADKLADALVPLKKGAEPSNVGGALYGSLFEGRRAQILQAALGPNENPALISRLNSLGRVLKALSRQLPEGSPTPTDIGTPGIVDRAGLAVRFVMNPQSIGPDLIEGLGRINDVKEARKLADTLLTPKGQELLKALSPTTPGTPKSNEILTKLLVQAGVMGAVQDDPKD